MFLLDCLNNDNFLHPTMSTLLLSAPPKATKLPHPPVTAASRKKRRRFGESSSHKGNEATLSINKTSRQIGKGVVDWLFCLRITLKAAESYARKQVDAFLRRKNGFTNFFSHNKTATHDYLDSFSTLTTFGALTLLTCARFLCQTTAESVCSCACTYSRFLRVEPMMSRP